MTVFRQIVELDARWMLAAWGCRSVVSSLRCPSWEGPQYVMNKREQTASYQPSVPAAKAASHWRLL